MTFSKSYDVHKRVLKGKKADLLGEIESLSRRRGYCYAKVDYLCQKLGICKKTLLNYYRELENLQIIRRIKKGRRTHVTPGKNFFSPPSKVSETLTAAPQKNCTLFGGEFTPIPNEKNHHGISSLEDFLRGEKKKEKGQKTPTHYYFLRVPHQKNQIREAFLKAIHQRGWEIPPDDLEDELQKFLHFHQKGSHFELSENVASWINHDYRGAFFVARERQKLREKERRERETVRLQKRKEEIQNREIQEEMRSWASDMEEFFRRYHEQTASHHSEKPKSLSELWEEISSPLCAPESEL